MKTVHIIESFGIYTAKTNVPNNANIITKFNLNEPFDAELEFFSASENMVSLGIKANGIEFKTLTSANLLIQFINSGKIENAIYKGPVKYIKRGTKVLLSPC